MVLLLLAACSDKEVASEKEPSTPSTSTVHLVERTAQAPPSGEYDDTELLTAIEALREIIDELESRIAALEGRPAATGDTQTLARRLSSLERSVDDIPGSMFDNNSLSSLKSCISKILSNWDSEYSPYCSL